MTGGGISSGHGSIVGRLTRRDRLRRGPPIARVKSTDKTPRCPPPVSKRPGPVAAGLPGVTCDHDEGRGPPSEGRGAPRRGCRPTPAGLCHPFRGPSCASLPQNLDDLVLPASRRNCATMRCAVSTEMVKAIPTSAACGRGDGSVLDADQLAGLGREGAGPPAVLLAVHRARRILAGSRRRGRRRVVSRRRAERRCPRSRCRRARTDCRSRPPSRRPAAPRANSERRRKGRVALLDP